eukprot:336044_1
MNPQTKFVINLFHLSTMASKTNQIKKRWLIHFLVIPNYCNKYCMKNVPREMLELIRKFYSLLHMWIMNQSVLSSIINKNKSRSLLLEFPSKFEIQGAYFKCNLFTIRPTDKDLQFGINLTFIPKYIKKIKIYVELVCATTHTQFQATKVFRKEGDDISWKRLSLTLSQCKPYKQLFFICYLDLLQIQFKKNCIKQQITKQLLDYHKPVILERNVEYIMDRKCGDTVGDYIFSETFGANNNHCWWLLCQVIENNKFRIMLRLFRLPINVKGLRVKYWIRSLMDNNILRHDIVKVDLNPGLFLAGKYEMFSGDIKFKINIEIIANMW